MYAQTAPKRSTSNSVAPSPISSSGVKPTRSVGRGQLRVGGEVRDRGHDLGHAGLVVGAEQRVAAGGDDVVADLVARAPASGRVEHRAAARQLDRRRRRSRGARSARRPAPGASGLVSTWAIRPIDGRAVDGRGQRRGHVAVVVEAASSRPERPQLVDEHARRGRAGPGCSGSRAVARGLGVDADVAQEAVEEAGASASARGDVNGAVMPAHATEALRRSCDEDAFA